MAPEHHNKNVRLAVVPIRSRTCIQRIVKMLRPNPRDHLLFVLGVNNGIRLRDLLRVTCGQLRDNSQPGDYFDIWEGKTKKFNIMVVNDPVAEAIKMYFDKFPERDGTELSLWSMAAIWFRSGARRPGARKVAMEPTPCVKRGDIFREQFMVLRGK
jgi:hypothetical protein